MNILYSYGKNRDEKTFFVAGIKKTKKNVTYKVIFEHREFVFFIPATQNVFSIRNFFARIDIFHMNTRNFCLNFFDITKYVLHNGFIYTRQPKHHVPE